MPATILSNRYYFDAQYDQNNNKISSNHSTGLKQIYEYDNKNRMIYYSATYSDGRIYEMFYRYNEYDKSLTITDSAGIKEVNWYSDDWKRIIKKLTHNNHVIIYEYDEKYRIIKIVDNKGITEITEYDDENNIIHYTSSIGFESISKYSKSEKLLSYKSSKGLDYKYEYDDQDRLIREYSEARQIDTKYEYINDLIIKTDRLGRVECIQKNKDGKTVRSEDHIYIKKYKYDLDGNLVFYERIYNKEYD